MKQDEPKRKSGRKPAVKPTVKSRGEGNAPIMEALVRGIHVLQCFSSIEHELLSKDIAEKTGLARATVFRITTTLCRLGLLRYLESRETFTLTARVLTLAEPFLARMTVRRLARPLMRELADYAQGHLILAAAEQFNMVVVESVQGLGSTLILPELGCRMSLSQTASGRAYLLSLPEAMRQQYAQQLMDFDPVQGEEIQSLLAKTRDELETLGYCCIHAEKKKVMASAVVPMRFHVDGQFMVFACTMPRSRVDDRQLDDIGKRLAAMVTRIEAYLGEATDLSHAQFEAELDALSLRRQRTRL